MKTDMKTDMKTGMKTEVTERRGGGKGSRIREADSDDRGFPLDYKIEPRI